MPLSSATGARIGRETTYGVAVAPQVTIPLSGDPAFNVIYESIVDSGRRDSIAAMDFDAYQGVGRSDISLEGMFYPEELGFILHAIMGRVDSSTVVVLGPTTNAFTGANKAAAETSRNSYATSNTSWLAQYDADSTLLIKLTYGGTDLYQNRVSSAWADHTVTSTDKINTHVFDLTPEGPSYTWEFAQPVQARRYPGMRASNFGLNFNASEGAVLWTSSFMGQVPVTATAASTVLSAVSEPFLGWEGDISVAGSDFDRLISLELTVERGVELLYTANNTQSPSRADQGRMQVTANLMIDYAADADYLRFLNFTKNAIVVTFTRGTGAAKKELVINLSDFAWGADATTFDLGSETLKLSMAGRAQYNTTDKGPIKFTLINSRENYDA